MKRLLLVLAVVVALATPVVNVLVADAHFTSGCRGSVCKRHVVAPLSAKWDRVAQCESGRRWFIATGNGFYGGLQFLASTWRSVGGSGLPNQSSILEQKYRASILASRLGFRPWPTCGVR